MSLSFCHIVSIILLIIPSEQYSLHPPLKWMLKHLIMMEVKALWTNLCTQWFPSNYLCILSVCIDKILTAKSHRWMWDYAFKLPPHQSHALKMWLIVCCLGGMGKQATSHLNLHCWKCFIRPVCGLLNSRQYVWSSFLLGVLRLVLPLYYLF